MNRLGRSLVCLIRRMLKPVRAPRGSGAILALCLLVSASSTASMPGQAGAGKPQPPVRHSKGSIPTFGALDASGIAPLARGQLVPGESIFALEFSPDDELLAAATDQGRIILLGANTLERAGQIDTGIVLADNSVGELGYFRGGIAVSPDGDMVAAVGLDGTLGVWRTNDRRPVFVIWGRQGGQFQAPTSGRVSPIDFQVRFLGDGSVLGFLVDGALERLLRVSDGADLPIQRPPVLASGWHAEMSDDLQTVVSHLGGQDRFSYLYLLRTSDWQTWRETRITTSIQWVQDVSADGSLAVAETRTGGNLQVWRLSSTGATVGLLVQAQPSPNGQPTSLTGILTRDGSRLVALTYQYVEVFGGSGLSIETWDISTGSSLGRFSFPAYWAVVAVRGDGAGLAQVTPEGELVLRRLPDGVVLASTG